MSPYLDAAFAFGIVTVSYKQSNGIDVIEFSIWCTVKKYLKFNLVTFGSCSSIHKYVTLGIV